MSAESREVTADELVDSIIFGMQEKKGQDIVLIDLRDTDGAVCDYFVICHGDSDTQVKSIAQSVEREVKKKVKERPWNSEGGDNSQWLLLDYVNVVVHIFYREAREFYNIEDLWADAKTEHIKYAV